MISAATRCTGRSRSSSWRRSPVPNDEAETLTPIGDTRDVREGNDLAAPPSQPQCMFACVGLLLMVVLGKPEQAHRLKLMNQTGISTDRCYCCCCWDGGGPKERVWSIGLILLRNRGICAVSTRRDIRRRTIGSSSACPCTTGSTGNRRRGKVDRTVTVRWNG